MSAEQEETFGEGTIVSVAGDFWVLQAPVRAKLIPPFKCPHCGGTEGAWFDRSYTVDAEGNTVEPMCDRCCQCGKRLPN